MKARVDRATKSIEQKHSPQFDFFPHDEWVLGEAPEIHRIAEYARRGARAGCTVLICGETGTGKEIWANLIHRLGARSKGPLIPVNCAALTPTLAESQLFGHEKGAFTGAVGASLGVFRAAKGGVVFLDEVGEMPMELQPKLLRVLQHQEVTPVGAARPLRVDVQVVAATNRNLEAEVGEGRFREDLYFRLNMFVLRIPPLRERLVDVPVLMQFFSKHFAQRYGRDEWQADAETVRQFCEYHWPGNVRQLAHAIEQAYVLDAAPSLPTLKLSKRESSLPYFNLSRLRRTAVLQALRATRGHKGQAAKLLGVHANTLTRILAAMDNMPDG